MKSKFKRFIKKLIKIINMPEMGILPGQLAFFFVLSIIPLIALLGSLANVFGISIDTILEFLERVIPSGVSSMLAPIITGEGLNVGTIIFYISSFLLASNGTHSMILASNMIYDLKNKDYLSRRIKALIMTLFLILLIIFMLAVPVFGDKIIELIEYVNMNAKFTEQIALIFNFIKGPISWFIIFILVKILYTLAPDRLLPSKYVNYGAIFTSVTWVVITAIFSYYISHIAVYDVFYGGLANIVILMLWFYLLAYVFTIGMALNYREEEIKLEKTSQINIVE